MNIRAKLLAGSSLAVLIVVACLRPAGAADVGAVTPPPPPLPTQMPAVDGLNGKAELFGGASNFYNYDVTNYNGPTPPFGTRQQWRFDLGGLGSASIPLGHDFGLQADGQLSQWNGSFASGGAAHLFWRNPATALLGVYGSGTYVARAGGMWLGRAAGEGEAYLGRWTLQGLVGGEFGSPTTAATYGLGVTPFALPYMAFDWYDLRTRFFDHVSIAYYLTDNVKFSAGHVYTGSRNAGFLGVEYLVPGTYTGGQAATLFVEGRLGDRNADSIQGGLRVYFGGSDKSLIRRQREDDPGSYLKDDLFAISNAHRASALPLPKPQQCTYNYEGYIIPCNQYNQPNRTD